jgi:aminoglycoside phosphotransferase (APT) family kinase protein
MVDIGWFTGGMRDERFPDLANTGGLSNPGNAPTRQELMRYYCSGTGRDPAELDYFTLLAGFKSGCILEYKVAQAAAGKLPKETGEFFARMVEGGFKKNAEFIRRIS